MMRKRTRAVEMLPLLVALAVLGCTSKPGTRPALFPVSGRLSYNGEPMAGAVVTFHPLPLDQNDGRAKKPLAIVDKDGSFRLTSYDLNDGAPAGEFAVTVRWTADTFGMGPDLLKDRYVDPARPLRKITVRSGENRLDPIALKGPTVHRDTSRIAGSP